MLPFFTATPRFSLVSTVWTTSRSGLDSARLDSVEMLPDTACTPPDSSDWNISSTSSNCCVFSFFSVA